MKNYITKRSNAIFSIFIRRMLFLRNNNCFGCLVFKKALSENVFEMEVEERCHRYKTHRERFFFSQETIEKFQNFEKKLRKKFKNSKLADT